MIKVSMFLTGKMMFEIIKISKSSITQRSVGSLLRAPLIFMDTGITLRMQCWCDNGLDNSRSGLYTVKHVYNDHAYNEMTLITKHLEIPGKHSIYFFINLTITAKLHIMKSRLKQSYF